jgi:hypothetical protein
MIYPKMMQYDAINSNLVTSHIPARNQKCTSPWCSVVPRCSKVFFTYQPSRSGSVERLGHMLLKKSEKGGKNNEPIGSMVLLYMVTWIPSIYPLYVSIYTSTMDPMGN